MYDRGHHRRFAGRDRGRGGSRGRASRRRRARAATSPSCPRSRSTRRRRRTSTTPCRSSATATSCGSTCTSPTSRRSCGPARRSTPRPSAAGTACTCPAPWSRCCPRALSNEACSLVPGAPAADRDGRDAARPRRAGAQHVLLPQHDPLRRAARLRARSTRCSPGGSARPQAVAEPLALARELAGQLRERRLSRGALAVESSEPDFDFDERGHVVAARDEVQTESHWVIEHLMILANEQVAEHLSAARVGTIYRVHEQPDPASVERLVAQLASLDVPTPPLPEHITPAAGGRAGRGDQQARRWSTSARAGGEGGRSAPSCCARSSRPSTRPQHRPRGARQQRLLPLHVPDPPLSRPGRPPRAAVHARRRATRPGTNLERARRALQRDRAGGGHARARRRRHLPRLPARAHAGGGGLGARLRGRGHGHDRERRVRQLRPRRRRRPVGGLPPGAPHARRLLRPERGAHGADRPPHRPPAAPRRPAHGDGALGRRAPRAASISSCRAGRRDEQEEGRRPATAAATSRPTARRGSATSCSRRGRPGSRCRAPRSSPCATAR